MSTTITTKAPARSIPSITRAAPVSGSLILRVALGAVLFPHGAQHLFGWFGGYGLAGTVEWMTSTLGVPAWVATGSILLEFFGPLALIAGAGTRVTAALLAGFMFVAASTHFGNGLLMNWFGTMPAGTEGYEFHVLAIAMALALLVQGGGPLSVDGWLRNRRSA